jgi:hypothetical protein
MISPLMVYLFTCDLCGHLTHISGTSKTAAKDVYRKWRGVITKEYKTYCCQACYDAVHQANKENHHVKSRE